MNTKIITHPIIIRPDEITQSTRYIVDKDLGDRYAITIEGNWRHPKSDDRFDGVWPLIELQCNYKSAGILVYRCDNADFSNLRIVESNGCAAELMGVRQCNFVSLRTHRCQSIDSIVKFTGMPESFSSNMINIGQLSCMGCDAPATVEMISSTKNEVRVITIGQLDCHIAWPTMMKQFPKTAKFGPRARTHLKLNNATGVTVSSCNLRLNSDDPDDAMAITAGESSKNCVVYGGQILKRRDDDDIRKLISGPVTVFPFRGKV